MADGERFGGAAPERALVEVLTGGIGLSRPYSIVEEAEIPWTLRRDARSHITYRTHYVHARKGT
jgi:hypothetical protein